MKKRWKVLIIVLVAFFGVVGGFVLIMSLINPYYIPVIMAAMNNHKRAYISDEDFYNYFDDFQTAIDIVTEYDERNGDSDYYLFFDTTAPRGVYDSINYEYLESDSFPKIYQAFGNSGGEFDRIDINNNFISFEVNNDRFAVVYSRAGSKPTSIIGYEDRGYSFYTRKVRDDWYFVTGT